MKKLLIILILSIFIIASTLFISGCDNKESPESPTINDIDNDNNLININIGSLKGPTSIGMIKLHREKPPLGEMVTTNYEIVPSPDIMISKILSGDIDIATLPTNVAVNLYNKGADYRLGGIIGYGVLYIVNQNHEINSWEDLKDKRIYITSKGSTPDVVLRYLLEENGIEPEKDLELDYSVEQVELSQLLISEKVNLAILPEPFVTMVLNKNVNLKIAFDVEDEWKKIQNGLPLPMSCVVIRSELIDNHTDIVNNFLKKYEESISWANKKPREASELVEEYEMGMDAETAIEAIPRCNMDFTSSKEAKESVNNYIRIILEFSAEYVGGKMPYEDFYY